MRNSKIHRQYGAVPFAIDKGGRVRVVLLTSRQTGRWVIPKGWPMAGRKPTQVAVREAYEEAGLIGVVLRGSPVGHYRYQKRLTTGKFATCEVAVFLLRVRRELSDWPERDQRVRAWFSLEVAAKLVAERNLAKLILGAVSDKLMQRKVMRTPNPRVASVLTMIPGSGTNRSPKRMRANVGHANSR